MVFSGLPVVVTTLKLSNKKDRIYTFSRYDDLMSGYDLP